MRLIERFAIRLHILGCAAKDAISEQQLTEELTGRQYQISATDLHAELGDLLTQRLLTSQHRLIDGRQQWTYRATPAAKMEVGRDRRALSKLAHEVFGDNLPATPHDLV